MKKLYSIIAMLFVGLATLSAQNTVFIGETGYGSLAEAVEAATDGATITIKGTTEITSRLSLSKNVTIVGETGAKIVGKNSGNNGMNILCNSGKTATLQNLTISFGLDKSIAGNFVESSQNNSKLVLENVTFSGVKASKDVVCVKSNGTGEFSNVSFVDCELTNNACDIFVGFNGVTLKGATSATVAVENTRVNVADFTGKVEFFLVIDKDGVTPKHKLGSAMVVGSRDTSRFSIINAPEGYTLAPAAAANKNEINLVQITPVVKNENTGAVYGSLMEAIGATEADADGKPVVLSVLESTDVSNRIGDQKFPIAIKGAGSNIVLKKTFNNKLFTTNNANLSFENLTLDCNNQSGPSANGIQFEVNTNRVEFKDIKITNIPAGATLFTVKDGNRTLRLENVQASSDTEYKSINLNGKLELAGDNNISINVANASASITATGALTNVEPIKLTLLNPAKDMVAVKGCKDRSKFELTNTGFFLVNNGENLVVTDTDPTTGIEDIFAGEENGPVDVYNMQGVLIKSNVDPANATEGLAKGVYIIGGKKIAVY